MDPRYSHVLCGALAVVRDTHGNAAFVRQVKGPFAGSWLLPGGGIEVGESPEQAAIREVREETGMEFLDPQLFALYEVKGSWVYGVYHLLLFAFSGTAPFGIADGFKGHNVAGSAQVSPRAIPVHCTVMRILRDAGFEGFEEKEIQCALSRERIVMHAYSVRRT